MPLNVESNVQGGVAKIAQRLTAFFCPIDSLDISTLLAH
jgi:hypothetical protein